MPCLPTYLYVCPLCLASEMLSQKEKLLNHQLKQKQQAQSVSGYDFLYGPHGREVILHFNMYSFDRYYAASRETKLLHRSWLILAYQDSNIELIR